ncbi:MAG TPA: hypothetical protein VF624_00455 [Tepidisphaeraceae bacterium]
MGLSFTSNKDFSRNNTLYLVRHQIKVDGTLRDREALKLILNIRQVHQEFATFVRSEAFHTAVREEGFERVKLLAREAGYPGQRHSFESIKAAKPVPGTKDFLKEVYIKDFADQQLLIREQAVRMEVWNAKQGEKKVRREPRQKSRTFERSGGNGCGEAYTNAKSVGCAAG